MGYRSCCKETGLRMPKLSIHIISYSGGQFRTEPPASGSQNHDQNLWSRIGTQNIEQTKKQVHKPIATRKWDHLEATTKLIKNGPRMGSVLVPLGITVLGHTDNRKKKKKHGHLGSVSPWSFLNPRSLS